MRYLLALLLTGCATFDTPEFDKSEANMQPKITVVVSDLSSLNLVGLAIPGEEGATVLVPPFMRANHDWSACVAGHELYHAIYGAYHEKDFSGCGVYLE
ncbi:MAG: hypothetical protein ACI9GW_001141 [Halieaceae bacterium]